MKASELELKEEASDYDIIQDATKNIYRKMRHAGLDDNNARSKIADLLRGEANKLDYQK